MKTPAGREYEIILTTLQAVVLKVRTKMNYYVLYVRMYVCTYTFEPSIVHRYDLKILYVPCWDGQVFDNMESALSFQDIKERCGLDDQVCMHVCMYITFYVHNILKL